MLLKVVLTVIIGFTVYSILNSIAPLKIKKWFLIASIVINFLLLPLSLFSGGYGTTSVTSILAMAETYLLGFFLVQTAPILLLIISTVCYQISKKRESTV